MDQNGNNSMYNGFGTVNAPNGFYGQQPQQPAFGMGMGNNNGFGYGNYNGAGYGMPMNGMPMNGVGMYQNNGLTGNMPKRITCNLNPEDLALIKAKSGDTITFTKEDMIAAIYNFRDENGNLTVEFVDGSGSRVRDKVTGEEFELVDCTSEMVYQICLMLNNIVKTIQISNTGTENQEALNQVLKGASLVCNNLPGIYERNKNSLKGVVNSIATMLNGTGYNGYNGYNMQNGCNYYNPSYIVSLNGAQATPPQGMGMGYQQPAPAGFYGQAMNGMNMGMGMPMANAQPMGGTMMNGGNPFMQQGAPAANVGASFGAINPPQGGGNMVNQMGFNTIGNPSVPQPGQTPQINAPVSTPTPGNPAIGGTPQKTSTTPAAKTTV